jgi:hypothetical protein
MNDRCGPVTSIDVLHQVADGLNLPDWARAVLGLAGRQPPQPPGTAGLVQDRAWGPGQDSGLLPLSPVTSRAVVSAERGDFPSPGVVPSKDTVLDRVGPAPRSVSATVTTGWILPAGCSSRSSRWPLRSQRGPCAVRAASPEVLEQLDGDVTRLAREYLRSPPYALVRSLSVARAEVFAMIDARPHPRFLPDLYRVAGRFTALLAHASSDPGQAYAADSHARSALLCAQYGGDLEPGAYVRWVQSNRAQSNTAY